MDILGKVAQIVDETRVVLNIGSRDGVKLEQCYVIFQEGDEVLDPDTKTSLGKIEIPKGKIVIEYVQEKMAIGMTLVRDENAGKNRKTLSEMMVDASIPPESTREKLSIDRFAMKPFPAITPVKIGDQVRLVS